MSLRNQDTNKQNTNLVHLSESTFRLKAFLNIFQLTLQGWKKPNPHGFFGGWVLLGFLLIAFLALYQCLNASTVLHKQEYLKITQG